MGARYQFIASAVKWMRCLNCGHEWDSPSRPGPGAHTACVSCAHLYVKWVNFEQWRKANRV